MLINFVDAPTTLTTTPSRHPIVCVCCIQIFIAAFGLQIECVGVQASLSVPA